MWRLGVVTASVGLVSPARAWREERGRGRPAGQRERDVLRIAMFGGAGDDDLTILNSSTVQERTSLEGDEGSNHLSTRCADLAEGAPRRQSRRRRVADRRGTLPQAVTDQTRSTPGTASETA